MGNDIFWKYFLNSFHEKKFMRGENLMSLIVITLLLLD